MLKSKFKLGTRQQNQLLSAREAAKADGDQRLDRKLRALLLVGRDGLTHVEAAAVLEVDMASIFNWQRDYRQGGLAALSYKSIPGRPGRLDKAQLGTLSALVEAGPEAAGLDTGVWTAPILVDLIRKRFGVQYSASQVRRILHKLGFSLQYPKKKLARADIQAQEKWLNETLPAIQQQVAEAGGVLFFRG